jgi:hypothetical protein
MPYVYLPRTYQCELEGYIGIDLLDLCSVDEAAAVEMTKTLMPQAK